MKRSLTNEQELHLCEEYEQGSEQRHLAVKYGCCRGTVREILKRHLPTATLDRLMRKHRSSAQSGKVVSPKTRKLISQRRVAKGLRGPRSPLWKGGRIYDGHGYIKLKIPEHPRTMSGGYVFEHRVVVERLLGRYLTDNEVVHHRNGVKDDNRLENLEVVLRTTHRGQVLCPHCGKHFMIQ